MIKHDINLSNIKCVAWHILYLNYVKGIIDALNNSCATKIGSSSVKTGLK